MKECLFYPDGAFLSRNEIAIKNCKEIKPLFDMATVPAPDAAWFAKKADERKVDMDVLDPHFFYTRIVYGDSPVLLCVQSDTHFGARSMEVNKFEKDRKAIMETPNAKVALLGDIVDNTWFASGMYEQTHEPEFQHLWAKQVMREYFNKDKLAFTLGGDHDEVWGFKRSGLSMYRGIQRAIGDFPFMIGPAKIEIVVGNQMYKIACCHKGKGSSIYSISHAARRLERDRFHGADAFITAHHHERAVDHDEVEDWEGKRDVLYCASGGYKLQDRFLSKEAQRTGQIGGIALLMNSNKHEILGFKDILQGIEYFKKLF